MVSGGAARCTGCGTRGASRGSVRLTSTVQSHARSHERSAHLSHRLTPEDERPHAHQSRVKRFVRGHHVSTTHTLYTMLHAHTCSAGGIIHIIRLWDLQYDGLSRLYYI
eukprot:5880426-Prymnesium_polylepis.1